LSDDYAAVYAGSELTNALLNPQLALWATDMIVGFAD
jgi:hypothetical protein